MECAGDLADVEHQRCGHHEQFRDRAKLCFELAGAQILFLTVATAGSLTAFTTTNNDFRGHLDRGQCHLHQQWLDDFSNTATAGDATITNNVELTFMAVRSQATPPLPTLAAS